MSDLLSKKDLRRKMLEALRHDPEAFDVILDADGYADVEEFVRGFNATQPIDVTEEAVRDLLSESYFDTSGNQFRAVTGHTTEDFDYPIVVPDHDLYYLIPEKDLEHIEEHGLIPTRQRYTPLEATVEDALATKGKRRIHKPVVLQIDTEESHSMGVVFYKYCGAWYAQDIPPFVIQNDRK